MSMNSPNTKPETKIMFVNLLSSEIGRSLTSAETTLFDGVCEKLLETELNALVEFTKALLRASQKRLGSAIQAGIPKIVDDFDKRYRDMPQK